MADEVSLEDAAVAAAVVQEAIDLPAQGAMTNDWHKTESNCDKLIGHSLAVPGSEWSDTNIANQQTLYRIRLEAHGEKKRYARSAPARSRCALAPARPCRLRD